MVPYYSLSNLFFYTLSIVFLGMLIPLLVYFKEYRGSGILKLFLGFSAGVAAFWSLSGTCPYPAAEGFLSLVNVICISASLFFGLLIIINKLRGNRLITFTDSKAHRWIMETLNGNYIITSPTGQILSCGQTVLSPLEPWHDENINSFLKRAAVLHEKDKADNRKALESLNNEIVENKDSNGNIEISGRYYHWEYHQLGEKEVKGYLLFLTDLTDEQKLINKREEAGRLLNLKNSWLRKQGRIEISMERSRIAEELSQKATKTITSHLIKLCKNLHHLAETDSVNQEDINRVLIKSREVMAQIRTAVHTLPYRKEGKYHENSTS